MRYKRRGWWLVVTTVFSACCSLLAIITSAQRQPARYCLRSSVFVTCNLDYEESVTAIVINLSVWGILKVS